MSKIAEKADKWLKKYQDEVDKLPTLPPVIAGTYTVPLPYFKFPKDVQRFLDKEERRREKERDYDDDDLVGY